MDIMYDENNKIWIEKPKSYSTIEIVTEEDYKNITDMMARNSAMPIMNWNGSACCPSCNALIGPFEAIGIHNNKFCRECGQKLKYEERERK